MTAELPTVSVVVATRDRVELLRHALASIRAQDYPGTVECVVVFDQTDPVAALADDDPHRPVVVVRNERTPGLAGARNSGIGAAKGELVAFCDDDDSWAPDKLHRQVGVLSARAADMVVTGVRIEYGDRHRERVPHDEELTPEALTAGRVSAAHPSGYLLRRTLLDRMGLVDEQIPGSYGEDYDLLLRAVRHGSIAAVPAPLVNVLWHRGSYFAGRWRTIVDALDYLLAKHPEFGGSPHGLARIHGQQAFALAALGDRRAARGKAREALRLNRGEKRAYLAMAVSLRLISAKAVVHLANSRGRGI